MIENEIQYRVSCQWRARFAEALNDFDEVAKEGHDPIIAKARRDSLQAQLDELDADIKAWEATHGK